MLKQVKQAAGLRLAILFMLGLFTVAATGVLTGCETMEGAGEDIENTGDAIDEGMDDDTTYLSPLETRGEMRMMAQASSLRMFGSSANGSARI